MTGLPSTLSRWFGCALQPAWLAGFLGAASALMLAAAAVFEHGFGLAPCLMCLWQRWPHRLAVALAVLVLVASRLGGGGAVQRPLLGLMAASMLAGAGIAFWHAGVEFGWFAGPTACGGAVPLSGDPSAVLDSLLATPAIRCDKVPWSFLGLSMAGWNGLISLTMAGLACYGLLRRTRS